MKKLEKRLDKMQAKLDLTIDQVGKIKDINNKYEAKFEEQHKKMKPLHLELKQLVREENININKVRAKLGEISNVEIEQKILSIEHRMEVQKLLTPDQKKKLSEEKKLTKENNLTKEKKFGNWAKGDGKKKDKKDRDKKGK
jgi:Spy/CpxP family protein refolding chaperone